LFFSTYFLFLYCYYCYYYQSLHLKQQAAERAALEARKRIACTEYVDGRPKLAVIFGDGMTKQKKEKVNLHTSRIVSLGSRFIAGQYQEKY